MIIHDHVNHTYTCILTIANTEIAGRMKEQRALGVNTHGLEAIPAPSTATHKGLLLPRNDAFLDASSTCRGEWQEQLLNDKRISRNAKLDLQARLEAANLGSLLFRHGPPASMQKGCLSARPVKARSGAATARVHTPEMRPKTAVRPLTARMENKSQKFDTTERRPATARPSAQGSPWRPNGAPVVDRETATKHGHAGEAPSAHKPPPLRIWAIDSAEQPRDSRLLANATPRGGTAAHEALLPEDKTVPEQEKMLLRCGESFKCQPDPRWKEIFRTTILEMKQTVELEREYVESMTKYSGKQISKARVQLNTPRDEPNKARVLHSKPIVKVMNDAITAETFAQRRREKPQEAATS